MPRRMAHLFPTPTKGSRLLKKLLIHLGVQALLVLSVSGAAAFAAILTAGAVGGVAMGVAPQPTFGLVEDLLCAEGFQLQYSSVTRSYHQPGESEPHLECVGPAGESEDVLLEGILAVLGLATLGSFAAAFLPAYLPLSILAVLLTTRVLRDRTR